LSLLGKRVFNKSCMRCVYRGIGFCFRSFGCVNSGIMASTLTRTSGKVGGMLQKPPLPTEFRGWMRLPRSVESTPELSKTEGTLKVSRSFDSGLSIGAVTPVSLSPALTHVSRSPISQSLSVDEGLSSFIKSNHKSNVQTAEVQATVSWNREKIKETLKEGHLIPDAVIGSLLKERLSQTECSRHGWLLDGFPRTHHQVDILAENESLPSIVIVVKVGDEELMDRLLNRRIDSETGKIYNLKYKKPPTEEIASRLTIRDDDSEHTIRERLANYRSEIPGILASFSEHDVPVVEIEAGDGVTRGELNMKIRSTILNLSLNRETSPGHPHNVVLCGPPGCGKGSQAELLRRDFGMVHVSTGDLIREALNRK